MEIKCDKCPFQEVCSAQQNKERDILGNDNLQGWELDKCPFYTFVSMFK